MIQSFKKLNKIYVFLTLLFAVGIPFLGFYTGDSPEYPHCKGSVENTLKHILFHIEWVKYKGYDIPITISGTLFAVVYPFMLILHIICCSPIGRLLKAFALAISPEARQSIQRKEMIAELKAMREMMEKK